MAKVKTTLLVEEDLTAAQKAEIIGLPLEERLALADEVWESIRSKPDELELTEAQRRELDRRSEVHKADPGSTNDLETVIGRIRREKYS